METEKMFSQLEMQKLKNKISALEKENEQMLERFKDMLRAYNALDRGEWRINAYTNMDAAKNFNPRMPSREKLYKTSVTEWDNCSGRCVLDVVSDSLVKAKLIEAALRTAFVQNSSIRVETHAKKDIYHDDDRNFEGV